MPESPRVLLVEDEEPILDGLATLFAGQGFVAETATSGTAALERLRAATFDVVVLDWMLPGMSGIEVLRELRKGNDPTPVLLLTARGAEDDIVTGLEAGADDYVTKPFGIRELVARVRGLLRRPREGSEPRAVYRISGVTLDCDALRVTFDAGEVVLTSREAMLLEYLVERRERAVTREQLLVDVWGYRDGSIRTRTVDVHVQQLRAKLKDVPGGEAWISTVRGRGYRFEGELA